MVLSNKGGPKVIHNGYMYTLHKKQPYNIRWRCVGRSFYCRGSLVTTIDCKKPRLHMDHNHRPDYAAAQTARKRYIALGMPAILDSKYQFLILINLYFLNETATVAVGLLNKTQERNDSNFGEFEIT